MAMNWHNLVSTSARATAPAKGRHLSKRFSPAIADMKGIDVLFLALGSVFLNNSNPR
jgi:hypothetical protein